jgi:hypothetical protein
MKQPTTYSEIADINQMDNDMKFRYVKYMTIRWKNDESLNCMCGYAQEWAERFLASREWEASDIF